MTFPLKTAEHWGGRNNSAWETQNSPWKCLICFSLDVVIDFFQLVSGTTLTQVFFMMPDHLTRTWSIHPADAVSQYEGMKWTLSVLYREELGLMIFAVPCTKPSTSLKLSGSLINYKYASVKVFWPIVKKKKKNCLRLESNCRKFKDTA